MWSFIIIGGLAIAVIFAWQRADHALWVARDTRRKLNESSAEHEAVRASWRIHQEAVAAFEQMLSEARRAQAETPVRKELP